MATNLEGAKLQCELVNYYLASLLPRATVPANCSANCAACRGVKLLAVAGCRPRCALALAGGASSASRRTAAHPHSLPSLPRHGSRAPAPPSPQPSRWSPAAPAPAHWLSPGVSCGAVVGSRMGLASQASAGDGLPSRSASHSSFCSHPVPVTGQTGPVRFRFRPVPNRPKFKF